MNKQDAPPASDKTEHKPNPKETAQEAVHQVMSKDAANNASATITPKKNVKPPLRAANGDDDLMSQPPAPAAP